MHLYVYLEDHGTLAKILPVPEAQGGGHLLTTRQKVTSVQLPRHVNAPRNMPGDNEELTQTITKHKEKIVLKEIRGLLCKGRGRLQLLHHDARVQRSQRWLHLSTLRTGQ